MELRQRFDQAVAIVKLDEDAIRSAAADEGATGHAVLFSVVAGLAMALGFMGTVVGILHGLVALFVAPFVYPINLFIGVGVLWLVARLLGGTGSFSEQLRPTGLAFVAFWVYAVPCCIGPLVGSFVGFWLMAVYVVIIRTVHGFTTGKAIAVVAIPLTVCCCLWVVMMAAAMSLGIGAEMMEQMRQAGRF